MRTTKYGVRVRNAIDAVYVQRSQKYRCPRCKKPSMRRLFSGVWACKRCGLQIADNAYSLSAKSLR